MSIHDSVWVLFYMIGNISGKKFYKLLQHFGDSFHGLNGYKFMASVAILTSGTDVGTWESLIRKTRAICAAADRSDDRGDTAVLHGSHDIGDKLLVAFDLLIHVSVGFSHGDLCSAGTIFFVDEIDCLLHDLLTMPEQCLVMVADQVVHDGGFGSSLKLVQMIEAFPVLCACRSFICRKQCLIFHGDLNGIFQDSFGIAGMGSDSVNRNNCRSGIEVFIGKLTDQTAVDGIAIGGLVRGRFLHPE